jgi:hypothetical protein
MTHQPTRRRRLLVLLTVVMLGGSIQFGLSPLGADAASKKVQTYKASVGRMSKSTTTTTTAPTTTTSTNRAPVAKITPAQSVAVGATVDIYSSTSYDPDGDPIGWQWQQVSGPSVTLSVPEPSHVTFTPTEAGSYVIRVKVSDDRGASTSKDTTVTVSSPTSSTSSSTSTTPTSGSVLWASDFERSDWLTPWRPSMDAYSGNRAIVSGLGGNSSRALQVTSSSNNDGYVGWGAQIRSTFDNLAIGTQEEVRMRYSFYVPSNWNPYDGGKLPGLAGVSDGMTVGQTPGGGDYDERGWSGRLMWRKPTDGNLDHARLSTYLYTRYAAGKSIYDNVNVNNGRLYGIEIDFRQNPDYRDPWNRTNPLLSPKRGAWNTIELRYKMNTAGQSNGELQGWLNGTLGVDLRDVQYRTSSHPSLAINELMFDSFYGGPTANTTTQSWAFDNVTLTRP